jgi:thiol-disulfide isomerase/thioredoxin
MQDTLAQLLKDGHQLQQYEPESDEAPTPEDSVAATDSVLLPLCHLLTLGGDTVTLDDAKGPLVLLDFWYRACLPCAKSAPEISKLHEDFAHKGLSVYAINPQDKNIAALRQYTQAKNIKYDIYLSSEDRCPLLNEVNGYPTFILYRAADKKILYRQIGYNEEMYATMKAIIAGNL